MLERDLQRGAVIGTLGYSQAMATEVNFSVTCPCGVVIRAASFEALCDVVGEHAEGVHGMTMSVDQVREMMSTESS